MTPEARTPRVTLALIEPPDPGQTLAALAPLCAELVVCVDGPLEASLAAAWAAGAALVCPLHAIDPACEAALDGRALAGLVAALTVARAEWIVALSAADLRLLGPGTLRCLTAPLPGDEGDVVLLDLSRPGDPRRSGTAPPAAGPRYTPGRYRRGCLRPLRRALERGRLAPREALRGLRVGTIRGA